MLNHQALALLADPSAIPATRAQQALRLFADYDLSAPRRLLPGLLDQEYGWHAGSTAAVLTKLARLQMIVPIGSLWMLAPEYTWTPASLAAQWQAMEAAAARVSRCRE